MALQHNLKTNKLIYHLLFWLLAYIFWIFIFRNGTLVLTHAITIQFCYLVFIAANYYFNALYNIPQQLNKKRYVQFGLYFVSAIIITSLTRVPVSLAVNRYLFKVDTSQFNYISVFFNSFVNILFWVVVILTGKMITEKIRFQRYLEQIEKEKAANELNFLRAQFNPHFLFNSINSIYAHIDKTNKSARNMLLVFSDMLRYQLYECNVEAIELYKEVDYIKNYIALQKTRLDERIMVAFCEEGINGQAMIAPLILITFIENAFKYVGFNEGRENRVSISLSYNNSCLLFNIFNTKDAFISQPENSSGLGIVNVKRRLELLYPNRHELIITDTETSYEVSLTFLR